MGVDPVAQLRSEKNCVGPGLTLANLEATAPSSFANASRKVSGEAAVKADP